MNEKIDFIFTSIGAITGALVLFAVIRYGLAFMLALGFN